ncbi:MAG: carboxypeptidase regulatory-like domain-containing protein [Gemmatimonadales bacterium]
MRAWKGGLQLAVLAQLCTTAMWAQTVKGTLIHRSTGAPVAGAYVVLLDRDSVEVTRALTNPLGMFTINAPRGGSYRLRTERIGYRSVVSSVFTLDQGQILERQFRVEPVLVRLATATIEGDALQCRVIGEQALQVLDVWEEARKALMAVAWVDMQEHLVHELERFKRWYSPTFRLLHEERTPFKGRHVMPFRSRSVEELERRGYVTIEDDSVVYEAPDAEVFFSDPFLRNHCFQLDQKRQSGKRLVGLRFAPLGGSARPDVKGVFWLNSATDALERLELSYVNVGVWQRERGAAGELQFEQLPDGRWIVSRWWIRMPMVAKVESLKGPVWDLKEAIVGIQEDGGEVLRVYAADGRTVYARGRATVEGSVFDSTTNKALAGAFVRLEGTERVTITEADGSFWLTDLPEGDYTVTFSHPRTALLGLADEEDVALEPGARIHADLAIPSPEVLVKRVCAPFAERGRDGLIVGRVRDVARNRVVAGARVRVVWLEAKVTADTVVTWTEVKSDTLGVYRACVPRNSALSVEVTADGVLAVALPAMFGDHAIHELAVEVGELDGVLEAKRY